MNRLRGTDGGGWRQLLRGEGEGVLSRHSSSSRIKGEGRRSENRFSQF